MSLSTETGSVADSEGLIEALAREMVERWESGDRVPTEELLDRHPDLWYRPARALELVAEEVALRHEYGPPPGRSEFTARFPGWSAEVETLLECGRAFEPLRFPSPGERLGEFLLTAELGRGGDGRVFLAVQPSLADRPVALKTTADTGFEHLSLARLQHPHIVPLHSVQDFPDRGLRALCMPYLGGSTLDRILAAMATVPADHRTGLDFVHALRKASVVSPTAIVSRVNKLIEQGTYVDTICRIGACLADALQYAHDRGVLHLDVKPSNILIAADGKPMLLDFHLAHSRIPAGRAGPSCLGGTHGYISPEHRAALQAVVARAQIPLEIGPAADVYGLGVVLSEALGAPAPRKGTVPTLPRRWNPNVSPGLQAILARCIDKDASKRYGTAAELAADLRRHVADMPLRGAAGVGLNERFGKWRRRHPLLLPVVGMVAASMIAGFGIANRSDQRSESIQAGFRRERLQAESRLATDELHALCERLRAFDPDSMQIDGRAAEVEAECRKLWNRRETIVAFLEHSQESNRPWKEDIAELGMAVAQLGVALASEDGRVDAHRSALEVLDQLEALVGPSPALLVERVRHAQALGLGRLARESEMRLALLPPTTASDFTSLGRVHLAAGEIERAAAEFDRALELEPQGLWPNYYREVCRSKHVVAP